MGAKDICIHHETLCSSRVNGMLVSKVAEFQHVMGGVLQHKLATRIGRRPIAERVPGVWRSHSRAKSLNKCIFRGIRCHVIRANSDKIA